MNNKKKQQGMRNAFRHACSGMQSTLRRERNFRIELVIAAVVLVVSILLRLEMLEWVVIFLLIGLVLALELANSALESLVDLSCPELHPLAKHTKDAMAGAVLVAAIVSVICGSIIFINAALRIWGN